jgi:NADH:ubiquinone oxidoreductase subunit 3 (subunit A)
MNNFFLTIPAAFLFYVIIFTVLYLIVNRLSAEGEDHPEKYLPYSGGQDLPPSKGRLTYQLYFRLGFLFGILHVAALIFSTLPLESSAMGIGIIYLSGISISVYVLAKTDFS